MTAAVSCGKFSIIHLSWRDEIKRDVEMILVTAACNQKKTKTTPSLLITEATEASKSESKTLKGHINGWKLGSQTPAFNFLKHVMYYSEIC